MSDKVLIIENHDYVHLLVIIQAVTTFNNFSSAFIIDQKFLIFRNEIRQRNIQLEVKYINQWWPGFSNVKFRVDSLSNVLEGKWN